MVPRFMHFILVTVIVETGSHYVALVNLELTVWIRLASNSQMSYFFSLPSTGIKGFGHCSFL